MNTKRWLSVAQAHTMGNSKGKLSYWVYAIVKAADLTEEQKTKAIESAKRIINQGKWRGKISEQWIKDGFTNEQFHSELFL
jgi:hypothetical protein